MISMTPDQIKAHTIALLRDRIRALELELSALRKSLKEIGERAGDRQS